MEQRADAELVMLAREGDKQAFGQLIRRYVGARRTGNTFAQFELLFPFASPTMPTSLPHHRPVIAPSLPHHRPVIAHDALSLLRR